MSQHMEEPTQQQSQEKRTQPFKLTITQLLGIFILVIVLAWVGQHAVYVLGMLWTTIYIVSGLFLFSLFIATRRWYWALLLTIWCGISVWTGVTYATRYANPAWTSHMPAWVNVVNPWIIGIVPVVLIGAVLAFMLNANTKK